ncbi:MAG TPA: hypothetical protein VN802_11195 [Stellaceae bacterium]|nr:hypothetical protein [Stellaceae bacterium]
MRTRQSPRQRGSVTILVLWGVAIMFVLLAAAGFTTRTQMTIARNEVAAVRARQAAEAGTQLGLARLLARRAAGRGIFDGAPEIWQDGAARVVIAIQDEAGKIDLNQAPLALLAGLIAATGRKQEEALLLACVIIERRGGSAPACPEPADSPERGAPFAAPEELAGLPGFGDRLYARLADFVTVASGASAIDPEVAPRTVLLALPGATPALVDAWLAGREAMHELAPESSGFEALPDFAFLVVSPVRDFTVSAVASTPDGARARVDLQIRLTGRADHPYQAMAFRTPPLDSPGRR